MGGACSTARRDERYVQNFGRKNLKGRDHLKDIGVDGKVNSEWILDKYGARVWTGFV
jgi:hypothetical protein